MKEKTNKKINNEWSYKFNETCLSENLWPTYTTNRYIKNCIFIIIFFLNINTI